jgi:PAS domain S-box-containing protein
MGIGVVQFRCRHGAGAALYALRLNRLFGTQRVGWWLFTAFSIQALLCLAQSTPVSLLLPRSSSLAFLLIASLLLLCTARIENLLSKRHRADKEKDMRRAQLEEIVRIKTCDLVRANQDLRSEIARRHEQEEALKASEEQYRFLFTENPQPMWVFDRESLRFLSVNNAALRLLGYAREEFIGGITAKDMWSVEEAERFLEDVGRPSPGVEHRGVWQLVRKDRSQVDVDLAETDCVVQNRPCRLLIGTDVTQRLELERQFRQAQKMEAIGQLAGGVAHDFNNILTVILGYIELLRLENYSSTARGHIDQLSVAANRAASLTRQLLAFSRRSRLQLEPVDVKGLIADLANMLRRVIGEHIALEQEIESDLPPISADPIMIEQVVMNLVVNARDAMPSGGTIKLAAASCEIDPAQVHRHPEGRVGSFVRLSVRDTGAGMPPEVLQHIFEPFFTTKDVGKGTGLGLATVYGIVHSHSGWIEVSSKIGGGSEFRVYLPCALEVSKHVQEPPVTLPPGRGCETVLLVEDEEAVRDLTSLTLQNRGYRVLTAECGTRALGIWEQSGEEIDLLFTDIVMPGGISGRDLAERLRRHRPNLPVVFTSGYDASQVGRTEGENFLSKPFNSEKLLHTIRHALTARS